MCRRALEASCLDLGAPKDNVLEKMIDSLEANRKITPYLKEAAHKVRLGGNRGAHPNSAGADYARLPTSSGYAGRENRKGTRGSNHRFHAGILPSRLCRPEVARKV